MQSLYVFTHRHADLCTIGIHHTRDERFWDFNVKKLVLIESLVTLYGKLYTTWQFELRDLQSGAADATIAAKYDYEYH